jgi:uncharacterized protein YggE
MLKKTLLVVVTIALLVPVTLAGLVIWGQVGEPVTAQTPAATSGNNPAQTITVVGQGSVNVKPDIAHVSVGVETSAQTVGEAVKQNETQMAAILAALTKAGIADKDIQTTNYSIQIDRSAQPVPAIEPATSPDELVYRVSNMVNVTVRNLDSVADILDTVIGAGANNIWGVTFGLENPDTAQADARVQAVADAKARAEALAELGQVKLGSLMSVSEVVSGGGIMPSVAMKAFDSAGGGSISPGEVEVSYQVQVTYFIAQ